jgi:hypothetical protein
MLNFLERAARRRKVQLFTCACCRRLWPSLASALRKGLETSERHADGRASSEELVAAKLAGYASITTASAAAVLAMSGAGAAARYAAMALAGVPLVEARWAAERNAQAGLLRDIFGPLLFREVRVDPFLLTKMTPSSRDSPEPPTRTAFSRPAFWTALDCWSWPTPSKRPG